MGKYQGNLIEAEYYNKWRKDDEFDTKTTAKAFEQKEKVK